MPLPPSPLPKLRALDMPLRSSIRIRRVVEYTLAGSAIGPSLASEAAVAEVEERDEAADVKEWLDGLRRWCRWDVHGDGEEDDAATACPPSAAAAAGDAVPGGGRGGRASAAEGGGGGDGRPLLAGGGVRPTMFYLGDLLDEKGSKAPHWVVFSFTLPTIRSENAWYHGITSLYRMYVQYVFLLVLVGRYLEVKGKATHHVSFFHFAWLGTGSAPHPYV